MAEYGNTTYLNIKLLRQIMSASPLFVNCISNKCYPLNVLFIKESCKKNI